MVQLHLTKLWLYYHQSMPATAFTSCFDLLQGEGDVVIAEAMPDLPAGEVVIKSITGDDGRLPLVAANNCVGIAAIETIKLLGNIECGVALTLLKVCCTQTMLLAVIKTQPGIFFSDGAGMLMHVCLQSVPHVSPNNMLPFHTGNFHRAVKQPCHHIQHCSESSILYICISVMLHIVYTYSPHYLRTGLSAVERYEFHATSAIIVHNCSTRLGLACKCAMIH